MNEKEFYDKIGGDYTEALERLMRDSLIRKFVLKFPADESFATLTKAVAEENWEDAFRASHTLKGVSMNLAFRNLSGKMITLTDALRPQNRDALDPAQVRAYLADAAEEYRVVTGAIAELAASAQ